MIHALLNLFHRIRRHSETLPETLTCDIDHWEMKFISPELGYSCKNPNCPLHVEVR